MIEWVGTSLVAYDADGHKKILALRKRLFSCQVRICQGQRADWWLRCVVESGLNSRSFVSLELLL